MKQTIPFLLFILTFSLNLNAACLRNKLCDELEDKSYDCGEKHDSKACDQFVIIFEKTLENQSCPETKKEPIIWSCSRKSGAMLTDLHYSRLFSLKTTQSLRVFTSQKFRDSLDGHLAEMYRKRSLEDQKRIGKSIKPQRAIPSCMQMEDVIFKQTQESPETWEGQIGHYKIQAGDVDKSITNLKTKKSCVADVGLVFPNQNKKYVKKVKNKDVLYINSYSGSETWETLVEMSTCKKIWEVKNSPMENGANQWQKISLVNKLKESSWKECEPCWNDQMQNCSRY